jgi:fatty acyl-CoA reductase
MGKADRSMFAIDPKRINWSKYMGNIHLAGLNRYALKDKRRDKNSETKLAPEAANTVSANIA